MVLELIIHSGDDGYSAEIPSVKGCESWAHEEEKAIENVLELLRFYLKLTPRHIVEVDYSRKIKNKKVLKVLIRANEQ